MQCIYVYFVNLFPQLLNAFVCLLKLVPLYSRSQVGHLWMRFLFSATYYGVVLSGKKRERKETRCDNSWFSVCAFTPVPPGSTGCLELHLPHKFMRPHPLSCLSGGRWFLSVSSSLPHPKPVKVHFTHFNAGGNTAQWTKVICSRAPQSSDGAKRKRNLLTPAWVYSPFLDQAKQISYLGLSWWPSSKELASWRKEFWNIKASHGGSGGIGNWWSFKTRNNLYFSP